MSKEKRERISKSISKNIVENLSNDFVSCAGYKKTLENILEAIKPIDFEAIVKKNLSEGRFKAIKDVRPNSSSLNKSKLQLRDNHYIIVCIERLLQVAKQKKWPICKSENIIYIYNGRYHERIDPDHFKFFLGEVSNRMGIEKYKSKFHKFKEELYKQFLSDSYFDNVEGKDDTVMINLKNGTLKINQYEKSLKCFDPQDFLKYQLDFNFDENSEAPMFQKFLDEVLPDKQKQTVLAEYCGYIFTKKNVLKLEKILLLLGSGANGKSVFFSILSAVLGSENISNCSMKELSMENYRPAIAGKLLNYSSELSQKVDPELVKKLASGEPIYGKHVYENAYKITDYAKMIFNCNELPNVTDNTNAYFRRFLIIHFDVTIAKEKMDYSLADQIIFDELPGVMNWILKGLERLQENRKLSACESADNILNRYREDNDTVHLFMDEFSYEPSMEKTVSFKIAYMRYKEFCLASGFKFLNSTKFSDSLFIKKIVKKRRSSGYHLFMTTKEN